MHIWEIVRSSSGRGPAPREAGIPMDVNTNHNALIGMLGTTAKFFEVGTTMNDLQQADSATRRVNADGYTPEEQEWLDCI